MKIKQESLFNTEEKKGTYVRFKHNCFDLDKDFKKGSEFKLYREDDKYYYILKDDIYHLTYKENCELIEY